MARITFSKSELAQLCEVSSIKVRQWCNVDYFEELEALGYKKNQHNFTPAQTRFLQLNLLEYNEK